MIYFTFKLIFFFFAGLAICQPLRHSESGLGAELDTCDSLTLSNCSDTTVNNFSIYILFDKCSRFGESGLKTGLALQLIVSLKTSMYLMTIELDNVSLYSLSRC